MNKRVVIESPLAGDFVRNFRFLLWCCRAVAVREGCGVIASHLLNPWFMDDTIPAERELGIANEWVWGSDAPHWFFADLGMSGGMERARERCHSLYLERPIMRLADYAPECWVAFERGEWPPHTPGFEVARG